jgi:hypothetical protein
MALIELNLNPTRSQLRQFAGIWFPAFWAVVGGMLWYRTGVLPTVVIVLWVVAAVISLAGIINPRWIRPVFITWMRLAYPIGWTVSHLMLAIIYYLAITPIGVLMRLMGRDPMQRRLDRQAPTYWVPHNPGGDMARYFRQS